jgi:hypothetical protein
LFLGHKTATNFGIEIAWQLEKINVKINKEVKMKKRILFWLAVLALLLTTNACIELKYEAYVTIVNIGNIKMTAWVDGDGVEIAAYDSVTWAVSLDSENEARSVLLEAEPSGGGDSDDITIILQGDRDVQTWLTGWDLVQGGKPLKKQSSLIKGAPGKELSLSRR